MKHKTIGIVGGGQLGRMLTEAAHTLGFKVIVLDPTAHSPAGQIADREIIGDFKDKHKIIELSKVSDLITFEIESANDEALEEVVARGIPVYPAPNILKIIKDKFNQKVFLAQKNIPVAEFARIDTITEAEKQAEVFGYPYLLKARLDAYDGRGNFVIRKKSEISEAFEKLSGSPLYAEKFVPFEKELAVVLARDVFNTTQSFEVVETIHKNNICHIVRSPANISEEIKIKAKNLAEKILENLKGIGVFAVEMFLLKNGELLVNEIAPRVHNSGHHTIEAYSVSQFEQHIRAITGMHLLTPLSTSKAAVMVNILGEREGKATLSGENELKGQNGIHMHVYGKMETRKERKMGHITALGDSTEEAEKKALRARNHISI